MVDEATEFNRLRWICNQRSMHEMDVILGGFFESRYQSLSREQAAAFTRLADMEDIDLWPLITGKRPSRDPVEAEVLVMLRDVKVK